MKDEKQQNNIIYLTDARVLVILVKRTAEYRHVL